MEKTKPVSRSSEPSDANVLGNSRKCKRFKRRWKKRSKQNSMQKNLQKKPLAVAEEEDLRVHLEAEVAEADCSVSIQR